MRAEVVITKFNHSQHCTQLPYSHHCLIFSRVWLLRHAAVSACSMLVACAPPTARAPAGASAVAPAPSLALRSRGPPTAANTHTRARARARSIHTVAARPPHALLPPVPHAAPRRMVPITYGRRGFSFVRRRRGRRRHHFEDEVQLLAVRCSFQRKVGFTQGLHRRSTDGDQRAAQWHAALLSGAAFRLLLE
jgi:hypothetical protein